MKHLLLFAGLFTCLFAQAQDPGDNLFDDTFLHEIEVEFYDPDWLNLLQQNYNDLAAGGPKVYLVAKVTIDGNEVDSVGMRMKGFFSNWGSTSDKKPFKIDMNEFVKGKRYDGLKKFNLGNAFMDPTHLRDKLSLDLMAAAGIPAPRAAHARLTLNGTYWGLYVLIEQVDNIFLKQHFDDKGKGNLYKNIDNSNLDWSAGSPVSNQQQFEKKTNRDENDWEDFNEFLDAINNYGSAQEFEDSIRDILHVSEFLRVAAVDRFINNWDSYQDHGRNYFFYRDSMSSKFTWIPWDYNLAFSNATQSLIYDSQGGGFGDPKPLMQNCMDNPNLRAVYMGHMCEVINQVYDESTFNARVDQLADLIRQAVYDDNMKETSNQEFDDGLTNGDFSNPGLKSLLSQRKTTLSNELVGENFDCTLVSVAENPIALEWNLYPNPSQGQLNIAIETSANQAFDCTIMNMNGQVVYQHDLRDAVTSIDLTDQAAGVYMVRVIGGNFQAMKKIIIQ